MKTRSIFFFLWCAIVSGSVYAQGAMSDVNKDEHSKTYFSMGGGVADNGQLIGFAGTHILPKGIGASISYKGDNYNCRDLPSDYYQGLEFVAPYDYLHILSLNFVKEFSTSTKLFRYGFEGGPSLVTKGTAVFTHKPYNGLEDLFESNYTYAYSKKMTVGLSLRAKMEFPLSRFAGLEAAVFSNINAYRSIIGAEMYLTIGAVRNRIKTKQ